MEAKIPDPKYYMYNHIIYKTGDYIFLSDIVMAEYQDEWIYITRNADKVKEKDIIKVWKTTNKKK